MIRKILLSLLILIAATTAAEAEEQTEPNFKERTSNLAELQAIRVGYGSGTIRIVADMTKKVDFNESYAENPSRIIIDLRDTWLNPKVQKEMELKSLAAKKIRVAQFDQTTVRIVIESMADIRPFFVSGGNSGWRFVIDVGNVEFKENPELNKPDPPAPPVQEVPSDVEITDPEDEKEKLERDIKEQREREKELAKQRERELKEQKEREKELERRERELEKREKEFKKEQERREKELKKEQERREKEKKKKGKDTEEDVTVDKPFEGLEDDLNNLMTLKGKRIAIDPGHGGNDAGAIGPTGVMEKNVTLKVALELKRLLESQGAEVIMTRETDRTVSEKGAKASDIEELGARCDVANRAGVEIFISIHADSFTRPEARGTTGYYYSKSTSGKGQKLADCIRRNLVEQLGTPSRGTQPCNFYVVKNTDMPATLIELGFISNKEEEQLLDSKEGVMKAAQGIFDGIEDYFG